MESPQISIEVFPCINTAEKVSALNKLLDGRRDLMAHQVALTTGCSPRISLAFLQKLYVLRLAAAYILVYHNTHNEDPLHSILEIPLEEGFPQLPLKCDECGEIIEDKAELEFDFIFILDEHNRPIVVTNDL